MDQGRGGPRAKAFSGSHHRWLPSGCFGTRRIVMGWRWRQYIRIGPLKYVLSRSGVGVSIGVPGLRYGVTAPRRRFVSVGVPCPVLYWYPYLWFPSPART